jgi:hypothetical protein
MYQRLTAGGGSRTSAEHRLGRLRQPFHGQRPGAEERQHVRRYFRCRDALRGRGRQASLQEGGTRRGGIEDTLWRC